MSAYNCSDPSGVSNGYYVIDKTYYENGDQVFFICHSSYSLEGNPTLTCDGATGNWSGTYPTCSATTTTTDAPEYEEWLYVGIGTISFIGFLLLLLLLLLFLKLCLRLCSKSSRVNFHRDVEEMMEVGCCYYCCTRCCIKCWSCCQGNNDVMNVKNFQPKHQHIKNNPKSGYTVATSAPNSVSVMSGETLETTPSLVRKEVKPARELNAWVPHTHGVRNINTSTRWRTKSGQLFMFSLFVTLQNDYLFFIMSSNYIRFTVLKCCGWIADSRGVPIVQACLHSRKASETRLSLPSSICFFLFFFAEFLWHFVMTSRCDWNL